MYVTAPACEVLGMASVGAVHPRESSSHIRLHCNKLAKAIKEKEGYSSVYS